MNPIRFIFILERSAEKINRDDFFALDLLLFYFHWGSFCKAHA